VLLKSLGGEGGDSLISSLNSRAGEPGSGRLADFSPALDLWATSPIVGIGLDDEHIGVSGGATEPIAVGSEPIVPIIFDNQYLHTIVALGLLGFVAVIWFVWGTARQLLRSARTTTGPPGDFLAACGIACAGYGASMLFYDSLAFIQVTLLLFVFAALGLRTRALLKANGTPAAA
jgi:O-antigen ligase